MKLSTTSYIIVPWQNIRTRSRKDAVSLHIRIDADDQNKPIIIVDDFSCCVKMAVRTIRLALRNRWSEKLKALPIQGRVARSFALDPTSKDYPYLLSVRSPLSFKA